MTQPSLYSQRSDGVLEIIINRPERKNAFTAAMYEAFAAELQKASSDPQSKVVLVRSEGADFSSGNDLMDFLKTPPTGESAPVFRFLMALASFPKPLIAAVSGYAIGIGTTMLLHADAVYAEPEARFQLPFVNLGLVPEAGSSLLLPQRCGPLVAAELLMFGEAFTAEYARDHRLITAIVDADKLLDHARARAAALAKKPAEALRLTKDLLRKTYRVELEKQMKDEAEVFTAQLQSPEVKGAINAFFEKRK